MTSSSSFFAAELRREINLRNQHLARADKLLHVESYGGSPVIVYEPDEKSAQHGNFFARSYKQILSNPGWSKRLEKVHAQARASLPKRERKWRELDSCCSSDALLMNVFCYPGLTRRPAMVSLLGIPRGEKPRFGVKARVPLSSGLADRTEVDMQLGNLLVEAKLTESSFQTCDLARLRSYRDFATVFTEDLLPCESGETQGYQLIRNVLAAHANNCSFCVLLDARRPDLLEGWFAIMRAVRLPEVRLRCQVMTWQELCEYLPLQLQQFVDRKYGIVSPGKTPSPVPPTP